MLVTFYSNWQRIMGNGHMCAAGAQSAGEKFAGNSVPLTQ